MSDKNSKRAKTKAGGSGAAATHFSSGANAAFGRHCLSSERRLTFAQPCCAGPTRAEAQPGQILVDGAQLEGGGQILRIASALSAILSGEFATCTPTEQYILSHPPPAAFRFDSADDSPSTALRPPTSARPRSQHPPGPRQARAAPAAPHGPPAHRAPLRCGVAAKQHTQSRPRLLSHRACSSARLKS